MRILILSQYFPPEVGAPQVRLSALALQLKRSGHEVEIVTALPNHPAGRIFPEYRGRFYVRETWNGLRIHRLWMYAATGAGARRLLSYLSFALTSIIGLGAARRPDYVFVESPPLFLSVPGWIAALIWRRPMIFNVADLWPDSATQMGMLDNRTLISLAERLESWSYRRAGYVNAVTEGIKKSLLEKGVPREKILFLPNGVDTELFAPREPERALVAELGLEGKQVVVYAGTIGFAQGLDVALQAMRILEDEIPQACMVFIGGGPEKERLTTLVRDEGLSNVRFLDPQPPEFVARLYRLAIAGFASLKNLPLFEGARPSKIFPIMASGRPVIYSGAGEGARLIQHADAGIVAPPEDPKALADAIRALLRDLDRARQLGANGRRMVEERFGWPNLVEDWLNQLRSRS